MDSSNMQTHAQACIYLTQPSTDTLVGWMDVWEVIVTEKERGQGINMLMKLSEVCVHCWLHDGRSTY